MNHLNLDPYAIIAVRIEKPLACRKNDRNEQRQCTKHSDKSRLAKIGFNFDFRTIRILVWYFTTMWHRSVINDFGQNSRIRVYHVIGITDTTCVDNLYYKYYNYGAICHNVTINVSDGSNDVLHCINSLMLYFLDHQ